VADATAANRWALSRPTATVDAAVCGCPRCHAAVRAPRRPAKAAANSSSQKQAAVRCHRFVAALPASSRLSARTKMVSSSSPSP
ncbi:hypothetical protein Dimus_013411, partial [Dionaea muscipula]